MMARFHELMRRARRRHVKHKPTSASPSATSAWKRAIMARPATWWKKATWTQLAHSSRPCASMPRSQLASAYPFKWRPAHTSCSSFW